MPIEGYNPDTHRPGPGLPEFSDSAAQTFDFENAAALRKALDEKMQAGENVGYAVTHLRNYSAWLNKGAPDNVLEAVEWDAKNELRKLGILPHSAE